MGGGLLQLVAYGAQDIYLTGNPQMTFFKVAYRRHTNFSMESIQQTFNGDSDLGGSAVATISRNGDLISRIYIEHTSFFAHVGDSDGDHVPVLRERFGDSLIKECKLEIGGQEIDKHNALWNRVYSDLTEFNPSGHFGGNLTEGGSGAPREVTGNGTLRQLMSGVGLCTHSNDATNRLLFCHFANTAAVNGIIYDDTNSGHITIGKMIIPLNFWFCRNPGLALPLIALQYHEVKLHFEFEHENKLLCATNDETFSGNDAGEIYKYDKHGDHSVTNSLWVDYIYLDTDERRRFAQVSHEYLIEQVQYKTDTLTSPGSTVDLHFNHPVKELIWCSKSVGVKGRNNTTSNLATGTGGRNDPTSGEVSLDKMDGEWTLKLNGHERFEPRDTKYFTRTQVWQHHTGYGALPTISLIRTDFETLDIGNDDSAAQEQRKVFDYDGSTSDGESTYAEGVGTDSIAVYSFALEPEEHQPSGTCNFSRIDSAQLVGTNLKIAQMGEDTGPHKPDSLDNNNFKMELHIFAVNYNVLRIMSGMGGLAYSN
jgi:hypothetical protein